MRNRQLIFILALTLLLHLWMPSQARAPKMRHSPQPIRRKTIAPVRSFPFSGKYSVCALSPDGSLIAVADQSDFDQSKVRVRVWRMIDGHLIRSFLSRGYVHELSFSPDGKRLAILSDTSQLVPRDERFHFEALSLWNLRSGNRLFQVSHFYGGPLYGSRDLDFSGDGSLLAFGCLIRSDDTYEAVRLVSKRTGRHQKVLTGFKTGLVCRVAISPDSHYIVATSGAAEGGESDEMALWRRSGKRLAYVDNTKEFDRTLFFLNDNRTLVYGTSLLRYHAGHLFLTVLLSWQRHHYEPLCAVGTRSVLCYNGTHGEIIRWDVGSSHGHIICRLNKGKLLEFTQSNRKLVVGFKHNRLIVWRLPAQG